MSAADVSRRREKAYEAMLYGLLSQACDARDVKIGRLQAKVGEQAMTIELLDEKIESLEAGRPFAPRRSKR